ncbi:MAG: molybdate ABC transporter substrate-binding protein [Deinococcus sp.]|nr:molybdate ABC transporter substrate-binding protein [Deinococcus sp.]
MKQWLAILLLCCAALAQSPSPLFIATAANLGGAFQRIADLFTASNHVPVELILGASGNLAEQIRRGAPFDAFAAANPVFIDRLIAEGLLVASTYTIVAHGRLVLFQLDDTVPVVEDLADLGDPAIQFVAIADPLVAPFGQAALQALERAGVLAAVQPKLVFGSNIQDALQLVLSGNADVTINALSAVLDFQRRGRLSLLPAELHDPILQVAAVVAESPRQDEARAFLRFLSSEPAQEVLAEFGLVVR